MRLAEEQTINQLRQRIKVARGEAAPDLVLKGGRLVNVFSREIYEADVAVYDGVVAGVGCYEGPCVVDVRGKFICPGFIDGHFHIESTLLVPPELAKAVIPYGTTSIVADPHEIANVLGLKGIQFMLDISSGLPVDIFFMLPSCVPATHMETAGAALTAYDLLAFREEPRILGLAEMMNYPGILSGIEAVLEKITAFCYRVKDGHAPLLSGRDLNAYIGSGIRSDHECTVLEEVREKLRLGMHIMIREGTQAKNLKTLLPMVSSGTVQHCSLVTDDLHPHDLLRSGHLNHLIDRAVEEGLDPILAVMMVTINTARYFGMKNVGAVAPGYQADILILSSLKPVRVDTVIKKGMKIFDKGQLTCEIPCWSDKEEIGPMFMRPYSPDSFSVKREGNYVRVIGLVPDQILTEMRIIKASVQDHLVVADIRKDILKIAVLERYQATGNIGLGLVQGFGLKEGAIASSVSHDSHNIICVGCNDEDMYTAVKAVEVMRGGVAVVRGGRMEASLPLPIAGLMSGQPLAETAKGWQLINEAARALGSRQREPLMELSFLALPVIPKLKITDKGLVDVEKFEHVSLFVS